MSEQELVAYQVHDDVAVLTVNNPPVNALSPGVPEGIEAGVGRAGADAAVRAVVLIGGGRTFIGSQRPARVSKVAKHHREAQAVVIMPAPRNKREV